MSSSTKDPLPPIVTTTTTKATATDSTSEVAAAVAEEAPAEDKSHTFRKRRLTFPTHNLDAAAAAVAASEVGVAEDENDPLSGNNVKSGDGITKNGDNNNTDEQHEKQQQQQQQQQQDVDYFSPLRDENEKSKTFRKRRLTLTKHQVQDAESSGGSTMADAAAQAAASLVGDDDDDKEDDSEEPPDYKKRRMSELSHCSNISTDSNVFGSSKIHHAGEILRVPPESPQTASQQSRLYAPPHNLEQYDVYQHGSKRTASPASSKKQPVWRRRMTRRHSEDERKLPFPRDVVGQYSCHGIEPVYDSDYEQEEEAETNEEDDDDDWLSEIPRENGDENDTAESNNNNNNTVGGKSLANHQPKPPRVTTSAKINQDRGGIAFPYGNAKKTALFAVYDGHGQGGELVSQYALHHVQQKLRKHEHYNDDIEKAFKETFVTVDEELRDEPTIEPLYAGTTACVALLRDNKITISNAGDSRAVLARLRPKENKADDTTWETIDLSSDQNPDNPDEQERIEYCGGYVSPPPEPGLSARVWLDSECTQIGLAMSRSIGDHAVKPVGVIAEPVVTQHVIQPDDDFMILASDGVWEFITSEEGVGIVSSNLAANGSASMACQALIEAAANKWHKEEGDYRDDITALVIRLRKIWDHLNV